MGLQDCPDWLLAEIVILSKITSVKMKLLVGAVIKDICGTPLDYAKVQKWTADAKLSTADVKACIACLVFVISHAAKHGVDGDTLSRELQQLGLPKENATSSSKTYNDKKDQLQAVLRGESLRLWKLNRLDWRVDYILSSSSLESVDAPTIELMADVSNPEHPTSKMTRAAVDAEKFQLLLSELKQAEAIMAKLVS